MSHVGATEIVALIGVVGTLAAALLTQWLQARAVERAAKTAHRLEMQSGLYLDAMEYAHRRRAYLEWLEDSPQARSALVDKPREGPVAAAVSARMEVYAPAEVRDRWRTLVNAVERLRWMIDVGGAYAAPGASPASKEDEAVAAVYEAIEHLTDAVRGAAAAGRTPL